MSEPSLKRLDLKSSQDGLEIVHENVASFMDSSIFATSTQQAVVERLNQGRALPQTFQRIEFGREGFDDETASLCADLASVSGLRKKWLFSPKPAAEDVIPHTRPFDPFHAKQVCLFVLFLIFFFIIHLGSFVYAGAFL